MDRAGMWLSVAIVFEVVATLSLKGALTAPWLYVIVVGGYLATFTCLDRVLRLGMPIGMAYGIWGAVGVAATALGSWLLYDEPLSPLMIAGIAVIIAGVLCIELGGRSTRRERA